MNSAWKASVIALVWLLNLAACLTITTQRVQSDLETKIKRSLAENALDEWKPLAQGQSIILTGPSLKEGSDRDVNEEAALDVVKAVEGVRDVTVRYSQKGKAAGDGQRDEWLRITRISDGAVSLRGSFMNIEEREAVHELLEDWFSGLNVTNLATFEANVRARYDTYSAVKQQVWMKRTTEFDFKVQGGSILIEGTAQSQKDRQAISEQVRRHFGKLPVTNKMTVGGTPVSTHQSRDAIVSGPASPVQIASPKPNWTAFNRRQDDLFSGTKLSDKGKAHLDRMVQFFQADRKLRLRIGVHTDKTGSLKETQSRAQSIRNYLVQRGIKSQRFQAIGFGSRIPAESGFHRRVTFQAL